VHSFDDFCKDTISVIHQNGIRNGPFKAQCSAGQFIVFESSFDVTEGERIERVLPNEKVELYTVTSAHLQQGSGDIPSFWKLKVEKSNALSRPSRALSTTINISNSQGFQVGDHNTQTIVDSFKEMITRIDSGSGTPEEKEEAKSRLKAFLKHPLTAAVMGASITALVALL